MNRHRRALQLIAEARPSALDGAPDRPVPNFPDPQPHLRRTPRPRHRLVLAGLVPLTAAAVGIAIVLSISDTSTGPQTPQAESTSSATQPATAQGVLLAAAAKTATGTQPTGAYWVTKQEQDFRYDVGGYTVLGRNEIETWHGLRSGVDDVDVITWLGAKPETDADRAAWQKAGSPTSWIPLGPDGKPEPRKKLESAAGARKVGTIPASEFQLLGKDLTYAEVRALPTDPEQLKAYLQGLDPQGADPELLFSLGLEILRALPVSPQVRAATYRMLAGLPDLRVTMGEQDARGRTGSGVSHAFRNSDGTTYELKLIIDPETGDLLATVDRAGSTLLLGDRFTDAKPPRS